MIKVLWLLFFLLAGTQFGLFCLLHKVENAQRSDHERFVQFKTTFDDIWIKLIQSHHDRIIQLETEAKELTYGR